MRASTRDRIQRLLCAALLNSELSEVDLRNFADEAAIGGGQDIMLQLSRNLLFIMGDWENRQKQFPAYSSFSNYADVAYDYVQRRRMSKKELLELIHSITKVRFDIPESASLREILRLFFNLASDVDTRKLMTRIQPRDGDPFLQGIMDRK